MLTFYKIVKVFVVYFLPVAWRYPLARWVGRVVVANNASRRQVIVGNLTPLVGAQRAAELAPALLGNFLNTAVDFFCAPRRLMDRVEYENWSAIEKAYRKTKRVICVTAHLGHWELGISCLVHKNFSTAGIYAPYRGDDLVSWIMSHRDPDVEWIPSVRGAADACFDALRKGRVVGIVADIPYGEKGRRVTIAGAQARLPLGPWAIAVRSDAVVFPCFIVRLAPGRYRLIVHDAIDPGEGTFRRQIERMQDAYSAHLERYLRQYPEQWGVLQPFWELPA